MEQKANITKKYRPLKFANVVGQELSIKMLVAALQNNQIPPAYLFYGIRGCGKTTSARLMAMSLNCKNRIGIEPCGTCESCKDMLSDRSEYLIEVDGSTYGKVENTRELMASIKYLVPDGSYKVVIVDECHGFTKQSWDASLKTIEEPPKNVLFIFCTTELQKVIPAIKSRCMPIPFLGVPDGVVADTVKHILDTEKVPYDEKAVGLITKAAGGSIRDAETVLEGFIRMGRVNETDVKALYQTIDPNTVITYFNNVIEKDRLLLRPVGIHTAISHGI